MEEKKQKEFRGLYKHVKISVKTLDVVIIGGLLLIVLLILYGVSNNGYTITFDSNGGSDDHGNDPRLPRLLPSYRQQA